MERKLVAYVITDGAEQFWTGGGWSDEYPDAQEFEPSAKGKKTAKQKAWVLATLRSQRHAVAVASYDSGEYEEV